MKLNKSKKKAVIKIPLNLAITNEVNTLMNYDIDFRSLAVQNILNNAVDSSYVIDIVTLTEQKKFCAEAIKNKTELTVKDDCFNSAVLVNVSFKQDENLVAKSSRSKDNYSDVQNSFKTDLDKSAVKIFTEYEVAKKDKSVKYTKSELFTAYDNKKREIICCTITDLETNTKVTKQMKVYWNTLTDKQYSLTK